MKKNEKKHEEFPIEEFEGLEQVNFEAQVLYKFYKNDGKYKEMLKMDLQGLKTHKDIPTWFNAMAENLLYLLCLEVGKQRYAITEIEFYLCDAEHPDPYVHQHDQQLTWGQWYFNGMGLDLSFGNIKRHAGILIRGIKNMRTDTYTSGVTKVLQELTKRAGSAFNNSGINIVDKTEAEMAQFKSSPDSDMHLVSERIGLTKKKEDKDDFLNRKYRYIANVVVEHKFKDKTKVVRQYLDKQDLNNADKEALCKTMMGYIIRT